MRSRIMLASLGAVSVSAIIPQAFPMLPRQASKSYNFTLGAWTLSHGRGVIHQLADGQNRLGDGSIPVANFTFRTGSKGGEIVDSRDRGCIVTPGPAKQFQCDEGVGPGPGFDIGCDGHLMYNGSSDFWACPVDDQGIENVYIEPIPNQKWCKYITLQTVPPTDRALYNLTGCKEAPWTKPWIYVWDRLYNNSEPAHPSSAEGKLQMEQWETGSSLAPPNMVTVTRGAQSLDGRCGASTGFHCFGKIDGPCCSTHGWCGFSALHCGTGCQSGFGICDRTLPDKALNGTSTSGKVPSKNYPPGKASGSVSSSSNVSSSSAPVPAKPSVSSVLSPNGHCGGASDYHCNGFEAGPCCSSAGWCGSSPLHCGTGCQSRFGTCGKWASNTTTSAKANPSSNTISPVYIPMPPPSYPQSNNSTYPPSIDCEDPANAQKCGNKFPAYGCPHDLKGDFEFPYFIGSVDKTHPKKSIGKPWGSNGTIDDDHCTLYNFDIRPSNAGKKCSLVWILPEEDDMETTSFEDHAESNSSALMEFWHVRQPATENTTWSNIGVRKIIAAGPVRPGFSCNVKTVPCVAGGNHSFMVCGRHFSLDYVQHSESNPVGLFIRTC